MFLNISEDFSSVVSQKAGSYPHRLWSLLKRAMHIYHSLAFAGRRERVDRSPTDCRKWCESFHSWLPLFVPWVLMSGCYQTVPSAQNHHCQKKEDIMCLCEVSLHPGNFNVFLMWFRDSWSGFFFLLFPSGSWTLVFWKLGASESKLASLALLIWV